MPRRTDHHIWSLAAAVLMLLGVLGLSPASSSIMDDQKKSEQQQDRKKPVKPELESKSPQTDRQKDFRIG